MRHQILIVQARSPPSSMNKNSTAAHSHEGDFPGVIAPPPLLYLSALIAGLGLQLVSPWPLAPEWLMHFMGGLLFLLGAGLARWSFIAMARRSTSASPRQSASALVTDGPFGFSRNPIYVAMTLLYLGVTGLAASVWPLCFLPPLLAVMQWGVILREEGYLRRSFGPAYGQYQNQVRRWL